MWSMADSSVRTELGSCDRDHWPAEMLLPLLSRFSRVRLCATPWTAAHQAPPSTGFSRREHGSGLPPPSLASRAEHTYSLLTGKSKVEETREYTHYFLAFNKSFPVLIKALWGVLGKKASSSEICKGPDSKLRFHPLKMTLFLTSLTPVYSPSFALTQALSLPPSLWFHRCTNPTLGPRFSPDLHFLVCTWDVCCSEKSMVFIWSQRIWMGSLPPQGMPMSSSLGSCRDEGRCIVICLSHVIFCF